MIKVVPAATLDGGSSDDSESSGELRLNSTLKSSYQVSDASDPSQQQSKRRRTKKSKHGGVETLEKINIPIPACLFVVSPFLEEALHTIRQSLSKRSLTIAQSCIAHAVSTVSKFDSRIEEVGFTCINSFKTLYRNISSYLAEITTSYMTPDLIVQQLFRGVTDKKEYAAVSFCDSYRPPDSTNPKQEFLFREMLIDEAKALFQVAEAAAALGNSDDASRLYSSVDVYLRMAGPVSAELGKIHESAVRGCRRTSRTAHNLIHEHGGSRIHELYSSDGVSLGKGNFGCVDLVTNKVTGDSFARKIIRLDSISPLHVQTLHEEIAILKTVDHPNIVSLKEIFYDTKEVHLILQYCSGGDLAAYLKKHSLSVIRVAELLQAMISSIIYIHDKGIVHRDLKLENFIFENISSSSSLKLIDFGLSKHIDEGELLVRMAGTPYYLAPEVWNGKYDKRCDVWSLGVCAFQMVYKCIPFRGSSVDEVYHRVKKEDPSFPHNYLDMTTEAHELMNGLLMKDPSERLILSEALHHAFFAKNISLRTPAATPEGSNAKNVIKYLNMSEAKKLMFKSVAFCLKNSQLESLNKEFSEMDKDKNGVITMSELRLCMQSTDRSVADAFRSFFDDGNIDEDAVINYSEFIAALLGNQIVLEEQRLRLAFSKLDIENTGHLTPAGMKQLLGQDACDTSTALESLISLSLNGTESTPEDSVVHLVFEEMDKNKDGIIDFEEFLSFWREQTISRRGLMRDKLVNATKMLSRSISAFMRPSPK